MSEEAQGKIPHGTVLPDANQCEWIIGSFVGIDGSAECYEAAQYHGKVPVHYPAFIKLKPHGDKTLCFEIYFFQQHANSKEINKWLASKDVHYEHLGLPYYFGSGQNIAITNNTNVDFLVLERYGSNLETLLRKNNNIFPKPTVLKIAYHILGVLEYVHQRGILLGNIQACNIHIDLYDERVVYLLPQFHASDGNAVTFWSRHQHCEATTKCGDFESLLYNLIDWCGGMLPWKNSPLNKAKNMKNWAFEDTKQFLKYAFPICKCTDPTLCMAARKCTVTGEPVAASKCPQAIAELMEQLVFMGDGSPNYKAIEKLLKRRLLNMYQIPTSKLEFTVPTLIGDEDHDEKSSRGRRKRVDSYLPGLEITADTLATVIAENCSSYDEVHTLDRKSCGLIEVLLQMNVTKNKSVIKPIVHTAWEKNTKKLRSMVVDLWCSKRIRPGSYKTWRKKKNEQEVSALTVVVKKKGAEVANHESPVRVDHADERNREEPIAPRDTNDYATDDHLSHQSTSQKINPADESSQQERSFSPSSRRDSISSNLSEVPRSHSPIPFSFPPPKSDRIYSPVFSTGSSGFSSLRSDQVNFHSDYLSPSRMPEQSPETVYHRLPEEVVSESREEADKTEKQATEGCRSVSVVDEKWYNDYELLNDWLEDKGPSLTFDPIPSEPPLFAKQVKWVRMLCDDFRMREPRIRQLNSVRKNPTDAEKLGQIERRWRNGLALLEERGKELGDTSLSQFRRVLQDVSDSLNQLPFEKEKLLCELENLAGKLQSQFSNTETVVRQLTEVLIGVNLQEEFETLNRLHEDLQQKIQVEKAEVERSIRDGRQFDDLRQEILVWLVKENEGISEKPVVSTDGTTLLKQRENYKSIFQRIMKREADVKTLLEKGDFLARPQNRESASIQQLTLDAVRSQWNLLKKQIVEIDNKLQSCVEDCNKYYEARGVFLEWLSKAERRPIVLNDIQNQLKELTAFNNQVCEKSDEFERMIKLGDTFVGACDNDENDEVKNELIAIKERWNKLNSDLLKRTKSVKDIDGRFSGLKGDLDKLRLRMDYLDWHDPLKELSKNSNFSNRVKQAREKYSSIRSSLDAICKLADELVPLAGDQKINISNLRGEVKRATARFTSLNDQFNKRCVEILEIIKFKKELKKPIPSVVVIDLVSSSDDEDVTTDASKLPGLKQLPNKQSLEKKGANIDSRKNVNRLGSIMSDSESGCDEKIEKKKNSLKRQKDSDPDWNCLSDTDNLNNDVKMSPRFALKKKKSKCKTRS